MRIDMLKYFVWQFLFHFISFFLLAFLPHPPQEKVMCKNTKLHLSNFYSTSTGVEKKMTGGNN